MHDANDPQRQVMQDYLRKVENGRSLLKVDPNQPALGQHAETIRQAAAVDSANRKAGSGSNEQDTPESFDFSHTPESFDFAQPEPTPEKKPFHPGQILDAVMSPMDPELRQDVEKLTGKSSLEFLKPETWTPSNIGKSLVGAAADALTAPMTYLGTPLVGTARGLLPPVKEAVVSLTREALDAQVTMRSANVNAIQHQAFPDPSTIPPRQVGTGNTLTAPSPDIPYLEQTGVQPGQVLRGAKGQFGRSYLPDLKPGEYRAEPGQLSLPGSGAGYPAEGAPQGKYILTPGEQVPQGMSMLRPQVRSVSGSSGQAQQAYNDYLVRGKFDTGYSMNQYPNMNLKDRILTPAMQKTLDAPYITKSNAPVEVTISKGGSASAGYVEDARFVLPNEPSLNNANTLGGAVLPSLYSRTSGSVTDAMRSAGPLGKVSADLIDHAYSARGILTNQDMINTTQALDAILRRSTPSERLKTIASQLTEGENGFLTGLRKLYNVPEAVQEQAFNYMITKGRMVPKDPQAKAIGDILFQKGLFPASNDPLIRQLKGVKNPFTGKFTPFGDPDMFHPQQPIHGITKDAISDAHWNLAYQHAGGESLGIPMSVYRDTVVAMSKNQVPEAIAARMPGLENMRLLDIGKLAEATGQSPYQLAKKLGYETDPFRATFKFNSLARLRGQLGQIEEPLKLLRAEIPMADKALTEWMLKAHQRALLNPGEWDATVQTTDTIKGISHVLDMTMLQKGGLANMAQPAYIVARGGVKNSLKGYADMLTGTDRLLIERSGATFPAVLNELTNPSGPLATFSSAAMKLYGLSWADRFTRNFAGHVGNRFIQGIEEKFLANPASTKHAGLIAELGGDPKAILQAGKIPDTMRLQMIQKFANHTAGITDVRGVPLWATTENPWARLINKYRTFATANTAEARRLVINAPTTSVAVGRVARLLAGAGLFGGSIKAGEEAFSEMLGQKVYGKSDAQDKGMLLHTVQSLIYGLGTVEGMFLVNTARDPKTAVLSAVGGPAAGVTAGLLQDLSSTVEHGVGYRSIRTLSSRVPLVGAVTGPYIRGKAQKEAAQTAENTRALSVD